MALRLTGLTLDESAALHQAIGWLTTAVEREHPGLIAREAARAASCDSPAAAVLASWSDGAKAWEARRRTRSA